MTRKKLGLGLLETFSEPCESCAGRGVIVFHDPVLKHRGGAPDSAANSKNGRKGRGGGLQREQQGPRAVAAPAAPSTSTHGITDELRGALSKIAASTINGQKPGEHGEEQAADAQSQPGAQASAAEERSDEQAAQPSESRRSRRGRRRAKTDAQAPASTQEQSPEAASGDAAPVDRNEAQQSDTDDRKARASENLFDFDSATSAEPAQTTREADPAALRELDSLLDALVAPEGEQQQAAASETTGAPAAVEVTTPAAAPEEPQDASVTSAPEAVQPVTAEPPKGASGRPRRRRITTPPLSAE